MKLWNAHDPERSPLFLIVMALAVVVAVANETGALDVLRPQLAAAWHAITGAQAPTGNTRGGVTMSDRDEQFAQAALKHITHRGTCTPEQIGEHLSIEASEVRRLLAPHVESGALLVCDTERPPAPKTILYRHSTAGAASTKGADFRIVNQVNWRARETRGVAEPRTAPPPAAAPVVPREKESPAMKIKGTVAQTRVAPNQARVLELLAAGPGNKAELAARAAGDPDEKQLSNGLYQLKAKGQVQLVDGVYSLTGTAPAAPSKAARDIAALRSKKAGKKAAKKVAKSATRRAKPVRVRRHKAGLDPDLKPKLRKAPPAAEIEARFAVFHDGILSIDKKGKQVDLEPAETVALFSFMRRIGVRDDAGVKA